MSCHVTKININKQPNWQNFIALFYENLKAFETINSYLYNSAQLRIIGIKYQLKSFSVSIRESYELSNSQKPKFIWSFLFLVVLRWDLSIKVLLLSYPCCYYIKHTTCIWTALILPWKGVERKYTDDWAKKTMHTIKYNKKFSFGKIQHNIQWDKFTPLSATKGQLSYQHWKSEKKSPIYIISSVD